MLLLPAGPWQQRQREHPPGCKDGNKYLRLAFGQAAVSAYSQYGPVKKFYNKIKRRSGKKIARAVVAKELAKIVWHILTKHEEYNGFKGQSAHTGGRSTSLAPAHKPSGRVSSLVADFGLFSFRSTF